MGLFDGLFGKKQSESVDTEQPKSAFFLDADDAKTFGNIDYMRTAKTVKKTFPGTAGREGFEIVEIISNQVKMEEGQTAPAPKVESVESTNGAEQTASASTERRQADTGMDMFRNMARDIKKK
jgi:hypothetical protein